MDTEALVKLASSGSVRDVEEAWLGLLEGESTAGMWKDRAAVLEALAERGRREEAEAMASTAVECLADQREVCEVLEVAGAFLLVLKDSDALKEVVAALYRQAYAETAGLEDLLEEAGVEGGRPPRRALRTMDVCLKLKDGTYLSHRHEDRAARVESVDRATWRIEVSFGDATESLGALELADNFEPADECDFRVMAQFDPDRLAAALVDDPAGVVTDIVRHNGRTMDSDALRALLSPRFIPAKQWTKWWTKARQALRLSPHVKMEGRAPFYLTYDATGQNLAEQIEARLAKAHDPLAELALAEEYVRGCKLRRQSADPALLGRIRVRIESRARSAFTRTGEVDLSAWLAAQRVAEMAGQRDAKQPVVEALQNTPDPVEAVLAVETAAFWPAACDALEELHPDNLPDALQRLLPHAPLKVADHLAERLIELDCDSDRFREMAERILKDPVELNEGLLWLWNGPTAETARVSIPLATILTRLLHALGELKRRDDVTKKRSRQIALNSREVLKARKYERFRQMLEEIEPGVAAALRTEITRLDSLARVAEDMLSLIQQAFPQLIKVAPATPKWLRQDVLFVTAEGYRRKHAQLEELVNVKMRANAEAIGNAAARGDLSENSEYKFALEERDLLQARLAQMQQEMDKAQVLTASDGPVDHVGIGCRVVLVHTAGGTRQEITILGPWEADPDRRIYNYLTPLSQAVLGTNLGGTTTVDYFDPPGEYRVVEVESTLSEPARG